MSARWCSLVYKDLGKEGARLPNFSAVAWFALPYHVNGEVAVAPSQLIAPCIPGCQQAPDSKMCIGGFCFVLKQDFNYVGLPVFDQVGLELEVFRVLSSE